MNDAETKNCIIDCRISSTKQASGGGLESQRMICENFAKQKNFNVLKVFSKVYSGRAEERKDFEEIINYIKQLQKQGIFVHYFLVKSIDRVTRDGAVSFMEMKDRLMDLGVELIDAYGIIQPRQNTLDYLGFEYPWSVKSPTASAELLEAQRAKDDVSGILSRMIGASIERVKEGYKVRQSNDGFKNEAVFIHGKKKVIQVPDPERSKYFIEMFEMRASGKYSDKEIVRKINALGYKSKDRKKWLKDSSGNRLKVIGITKGKELDVKKLQRIVQRPIYAGIMCEKWTHNKPIKAQYDGLVSVEIFNLANRGKVLINENEEGVEILYDQKHPEKFTAKRLKFNPLYCYDKMILCPKGCNKPTLSSCNTGKLGTKYPAYHCNRSHYWRVPKKEFEENVSYYLENIKFAPEFIKSFEFVLLKKYRQREKELAHTSSNIHKNISDLKTEQTKALDTYESTSSQVIRDRMEEKIERLDKEIKQAREFRLETEIQEGDIKSFISYVKDLMEHPVKMLINNSNPYKQKALFNLVFEEIPTYQEILNGTPKLSLVFRLSEAFVSNKSQSVTLRGIEPRFPG